MTISTLQNSVTVGGNGSVTQFSFPFVADQATDIVVVYTNSSGAQTTLSPSQYSVTLNAISPGAQWSVGGFVQYPLVGSPIANGTSLTISRILPIEQETSLANNSNYQPTVIEQALDVLCMLIQQLAARGGAIRGTWTTNTVYNFGDIVQDGTNGLNSKNYYTCAIANTSGSWVTDLANGDWILSLPAVIPAATFPLSITNGGTGASTAGTALTNLGGIALSANNVFTGSNSFTGGSIAVPTASAADASTKAASTAFVNNTALTLAAGTTAVTQSTGDSSTKVATTAFVATATALPSPFGIGSYVLAKGLSNTQYLAGATSTGSNLTVINFASGSFGVNSTGDSLTGTWQAMQTLGSNASPPIGLWLRIS